MFFLLYFVQRSILAVSLLYKCFYMCIIIRHICTVVGIVREFGSSPTYMFVYVYLAITVFRMYGVTMCNRFIK